MAGIKYKMKKKHDKISFGMAGIYVILTAWALTTIYPLFWILMNSFKNKKVIRSDSFSLPVGELFTLDNYKTAFERVNILGAYRNSLVISISVAAAVILLVLPRFGINLLGEKEPEQQVEEKIPKKGVEAYTVGEDTVASLDTVLEEGEGARVA